MFEMSTAMFFLLIEVIVILIISIIVATALILRNRKKDREAAMKLIEQIQHQSEVRRQTTGEFLKDKYYYEGNELEKAIQDIERTEKKFIQTMLNAFLKRDRQGILSMDASLAEVVDVYKGFQPRDQSEELRAQMSDEIETLVTENETLKSELTESKDTIDGMMSEFGNLFEGGATKKEIDREAARKKMEELKAKTVSDAALGSGHGDASVDVVDVDIEQGDESSETEIIDTQASDSADMGQGDIDSLFEPATDTTQQDEADEEDIDDLITDAIQPAATSDASPSTDESTQTDLATDVDDLLADVQAQTKDQQAGKDNQPTDQMANNDDDVTGIDISSEEDIDKLLENIDMSRDKKDS